MIRIAAIGAWVWLAAAGQAAPRMDLIAGTWRDDLTDLVGIGENRQGLIVAPAGFSIDPGIQTYTNPYSTVGHSEYFSAPGSVAGPTLKVEFPGATTESLTLWSAIYMPKSELQYAYDCAYGLKGADGPDCEPNILQNGQYVPQFGVPGGISNVPYEGRNLLNAVGWDMDLAAGYWPATGELIVTLNCMQTTLPGEGNPTTGTIGLFYGQPLLDGLSIDQIVPGRDYTATWVAGALLGSNHQGHTTTAYLGFEFLNLDTKATYGGTTLYEGDFISYSLPEFNKGSPVMEPLNFNALTPVAARLAASENTAPASWDLRALSLVPPAAADGHPHCTALGPVWLVADKAEYASPVFDTGSNYTRWVDLCWEIDTSTHFIDSIESAVPVGSPITPVRLSYGVSSTKAPVLPVSWTVSHGGEAIAGVIGRNMIAPPGTVACNFMQDPAGAPLVGRYFQWSAVLYGRSAAQEVDPDLEPSPRPAYFGGFRPTIRRISARYYVCSAFMTSKKIAPPGVLRWKALNYIVEKPSAGASVVVDVLSGSDGSVLMANAPPGASLEGISALSHASLVLRATLESDPADCERRPVLRSWQASWEPLADVILVACNAIRPAAGESCRMQLRVERPGRAVVEVHDAAGQLVRSLLDGEVGAGALLLEWDGRGAAAEPVSAGVYFLHARVPGGRRVVRLAVLR